MAAQVLHSRPVLGEGRLGEESAGVQARGDVESGYARGALPAELIHLGGHLQEEAALLTESGALQSAP